MEKDVGCIKFKQLASAFQKHIGKLGKIFCCCRCGLREGAIDQIRKRKADDDNHGLAGSPKSDGPHTERTNQKEKKNKIGG